MGGAGPRWPACRSTRFGPPQRPSEKVRQLCQGISARQDSASDCGICHACANDFALRHRGCARGLSADWAPLGLDGWLVGSQCDRIVRPPSANELVDFNRYDNRGGYGSHPEPDVNPDRLDAKDQLRSRHVQRSRMDHECHEGGQEEKGIVQRLCGHLQRMRRRVANARSHSTFRRWTVDAIHACCSRATTRAWTMSGLVQPRGCVLDSARKWEPYVAPR